MYLSLYIYIYIYIERERDRERERDFYRKRYDLSPHALTCAAPKYEDPYQ